MNLDKMIEDLDDLYAGITETGDLTACDGLIKSLADLRTLGRSIEAKAMPRLLAASELRGRILLWSEHENPEIKH